MSIGKPINDAGQLGPDVQKIERMPDLVPAPQALVLKAEPIKFLGMSIGSNEWMWVGTYSKGYGQIAFHFGVPGYPPAYYYDHQLFSGMESQGYFQPELLVITNATKITHVLRLDDPAFVAKLHPDWREAWVKHTKKEK